MTPEQWQNVADCARQRWGAIWRKEIADGGDGAESDAYWARRAGEFDSWQMALEKCGRTPF